jgi:arylsulfatase A-like enzyme
MFSRLNLVFLGAMLLFATASQAQKNSKPNIIIIYTDDLGYGDPSCYNPDSKLYTPNIDQLAASGIRFTNGHATSATCTPSRYALLTGQYPWKNKDAAVLPGDAPLIIPTSQLTLPGMLKATGYRTGIVGKWHLGLGGATQKNWNERVSPGPNELGFDYSFIFPATADRVPTIFIENGVTTGADPSDPIAVDYTKKIGSEPTGKANPELLKMKNSPNHGHDNTIVNGIGRIGFMTGGKTARWTDEEIPFTFLDKARSFIRENQTKPFFLYYSLTEPHVPRMPSTMFKGRSGLGFRGDAILQIDWAVGEIIAQLKALKLYENTLIIFSSDNGPVLDDGYEDGAVTQQNGHLPWGKLRGGKYSSFEAGTRVPTILSWPGKIKGGHVSDALVCQLDLLASMASLTGYHASSDKIADSQNQLNAWLGKDTKGRDYLIKNNANTPGVIIRGDWKLIKANNRQAMSILTNTELGNLPADQLYDLKTDIGERFNLSEKNPEIVKQLNDLLLIETGKSGK